MRPVNTRLFFRRPPRAFTLVELLVVMAIIIVLIGLSVPVVNALKNSGDITSTAYDLSDTLGRARTYAMSNSTYVWVGLFEEDGSRASTIPAVAGKGRLIVSTVYSKDGTSVHDPGGSDAASGSVSVPLDATRLTQYGKLVRLDRAHLTDFFDPPGSSVVFKGKPTFGNDPTACVISDRYPDPSRTPYPYPYSFTYPLTGNAQYTFIKMIQFSPRGETRINCLQDMKPLIEIGLMHARGANPDNNKNVVAIQVSGIASNVKIYRP